MSADKIIEGLLDAATGNFARATFVGIDMGSKDFSAVMCPRCKTPHQWRVRQPTACRHCGLPFVFKTESL